MKKTFKTLLCTLCAVFALSSCVDVPSPYNVPTKSGTGSTDSGETVTGTPATCAEALAIVNALADGATTTEVYTVTGYITDVFTIASTGKQCFYIDDTAGGGKVIEAFDVTAGETAFAVGQKVSITGKLKKYVNKSGAVIPEIDTPTVVILESGDGVTLTSRMQR